MIFLEKYSILFIASILCAEAILTALTITAYIKTNRKTLYSRKGTSYLGGSIFMVIMLCFSFAMIFSNNKGVNPTLAYITDISRISVMFPLIALPLLILFLFFMSVSNISLLRHEGKTLKNIIGSILGFVLILATVSGIFGWDIIYSKIIFNLLMKGYQWITVLDIAIPMFLTSLLCYVECLLFATVISGIRAARHIPAYDKDYVIILGCALSKDGTPLPLLKGRIDRAISFAKQQYEATGKRIKFVPSGGQGADECISEADSMRNYLISQGIDESDILVENKSVNTLENMKFSKALIDADNNGDKVIFSTTNYHVFRSGIYADSAGLNAEGIAAKTKWYFWPNAFVREFAALVVSGKKAHIFNTLIFLAISIVVGYSYYLMTM